MNHCATCKHFEPDPSVADDNEYAAFPNLLPGFDWGECALARTSDATPIRGDGTISGTSYRPETRPLAMAIDSSGYHSELVVSPEYGCVQWEQS